MLLLLCQRQGRRRGGECRGTGDSAELRRRREKSKSREESEARRARLAAPEWGIGMLFFRWRSHDGSTGGAGILGRMDANGADGSGESTLICPDAVRRALLNLKSPE
jgi:hypothetical protein